MCAEPGSPAAPEVHRPPFDQIDPHISGRRATPPPPPPFHRRILNHIWRINRKSRNAGRILLLYTKALNVSGLFPPKNAGYAEVLSHVQLWRTAIEYHPASNFSHCGMPIFGCSVGGGVEKKPQILLPTLLRRRSQLCCSGLKDSEHVAAFLESEHLRLRN